MLPDQLLFPLAKERLDELIREADAVRRANELAPGQPLRAQIATLLHALAERIDPAPTRALQTETA